MPVISISDDEVSAIDSDGDQGISAVKAHARTAAQLAGVQVKNSQSARFAQKFAGKTPEETLGKYLLLFRITLAVWLTATSQIYSRRDGAQQSTSISASRKSSRIRVGRLCTGLSVKREFSLRSFLPPFTQSLTFAAYQASIKAC